MSATEWVECVCGADITHIEFEYYPQVSYTGKPELAEAWVDRNLGVLCYPDTPNQSDAQAKHTPYKFEEGDNDE